MDQFYVHTTKVVKLKSGKNAVIIRGLRTADEIHVDLLTTTQGNEAGVKPVSEMTDDDWRGLGLVPPSQQAAVSVKSPDSAKVLADNAPPAADLNPRGSTKPEATA